MFECVPLHSISGRTRSNTTTFPLRLSPSSSQPVVSTYFASLPPLALPSSLSEMDQSPPAWSDLVSPVISFSQESRTLSIHSYHSSQSSNSILTRWPSPVLPDYESLEKVSSADEHETFSEYADDRYPLLWYGVLLLDPFTAHLRVPDAVSRLIADLENRHAGSHPPPRRSIRDSNELHMLWGHSTRGDIRLYFQGSGISLFPGEQLLLHSVSGEPIYHHLMRRMDSRFSIQAPTPDVMYGYREAALHRPNGIPSWVIEDGKARDEPVLPVLDSPDARSWLWIRRMYALGNQRVYDCFVYLRQNARQTQPASCRPPTRRHIHNIKQRHLQHRHEWRSCAHLRHFFV